MAKLPATLDISENLSVTPVKVPLFISNPLGFKAVYLLTNYDELARRTLLAQHVGLVGRRDMEVWLDEGASVLRNLFGLAQSYQFSGATATTSPQTMLAPKPRGRCTRSSARSRRTSGGHRRSNFAPPITRGALAVMPMMTLTVSSSRTDRNAAARPGPARRSAAAFRHSSKLPTRRSNTVPHFKEPFKAF
ncbi:TIGR03761 family integrating conjugative element protein [Pseudomonas aeruginosa]|nr:TIGR03761 family integrating conjugative element protein [Pseudomonas aeruginosa]